MAKGEIIWTKFKIFHGQYQERFHVEDTESEERVVEVVGTLLAEGATTVTVDVVRYENEDRRKQRHPDLKKLTK